MCICLVVLFEENYTAYNCRIFSIIYLISLTVTLICGFKIMKIISDMNVYSVVDMNVFVISGSFECII